jgi:hypothetical protein
MGISRFGFTLTNRRPKCLGRLRSGKNLGICHQIQFSCPLGVGFGLGGIGTGVGGMGAGAGEGVGG